jgi:hypothetical protein
MKQSAFKLTDVVRSGIHDVAAKLFGQRDDPAREPRPFVRRPSRLIAGGLVPTGSRPSAPIISSAQARVGSVLERDRVIVFAQEIQQRWWRSDALIGSRKARPQRGPLLSV